jgi:hypothetical protein
MPARKIRSEPMRTMLFLALNCFVSTPTQVAFSAATATGPPGRFDAIDEAGSPAAIILVISLSTPADSPEHDGVAIRGKSV